MATGGMNRSKSPNVTKSFEKKTHKNVKINFHKNVKEENVVETLNAELSHPDRYFEEEEENLHERRILGQVYSHPEDRIDFGRDRKDLSKFGGFGGLDAERIKDKVLKGEPLKLSKCEELPEESFKSGHKFELNGAGFDPQHKLDLLKKELSPSTEEKIIKRLDH